MKIGIDVKMTTLGQNAQAPSIFGLCTIIWALSTLLVLLVHSQLDHELDHISTTKVNKRIRRESLSPVMHRLSQNETRTELFGKVHTIATVPERKRSMLVNYGIISSGEYSPEASSKCPLDKSSIEPCTCRSLARGITVECEGLENSKRLTSAFRDLRPYLMHDTVLISIDFKIKNEVFDSMNFIILTFRKGNVIISGEPGSYSLAKLNHTKDALQQVNFMQCIVDLGETTLSHKKLKNLELFETQFKNYNYRWFENLQVEKVRINSPHIQANVSEYMIGVTHLIHSNSDLGSVNRRMLPRDVSALRSIDFSTNGLISLPDRFLDDIPQLEEVILKGNCFTTIHKRTFSPVWLKMKLLNLEANTKLRCTDLDWLRTRFNTQVKVKGDCLDDDNIVQKI